VGTSGHTEKARFGQCEVQRAVDEFATENKVDVMFTRERCPNWIVRKP